MLNIAYDRENSTEMNPVYFVYQNTGEIIYTGSYTQCLVVIGALTLDDSLLLTEINEKANGFLFERSVCDSDGHPLTCNCYPVIPNPGL